MLAPTYSCPDDVNLLIFATVLCPYIKLKLEIRHVYVPVS